eukprot:7376385-Prymnesium_polylepis.2
MQAAARIRCKRVEHGTAIGDHHPTDVQRDRPALHAGGRIADGTPVGHCQAGRVRDVNRTRNRTP